MGHGMAIFLRYNANVLSQSMKVCFPGGNGITLSGPYSHPRATLLQDLKAMGEFINMSLRSVRGADLYSLDQGLLNPALGTSSAL